MKHTAPPAIATSDLPPRSIVTEWETSALSRTAGAVIAILSASSRSPGFTGLSGW